MAFNNLQGLICRKTQLTITQLAAAVEYTNCISTEGVKHPLHECPVMTPSNLIGSSNAGASGYAKYPFHCHCSQVQSDPDW